MDLVLNGLRKQFSVGTDQFIALDDLSLDIPSGQFVAVMGSNGAGKSTMLGAVAGSVFVDSGVVQLDGRDVTRLAEHRRARLIARVFQDPRVGTSPELTIAENFALASLRTGRRTLRQGVTRGLRAQIVDRFKSCELPDLSQRLDQRVGTLSGGQRQAVALLMATWSRPGLLLLDEHTAALDPDRAEAIMKLTAKLQSEMELTVLMITHSPEQAVAYGDRLVLLDRGRVVVDVGTDEKRSLTVPALIELFRSRGAELDDRALLQGAAVPGQGDAAEGS